MSSTSRITGTGLNQCRPIARGKCALNVRVDWSGGIAGLGGAPTTLAGNGANEARREIDSDDVLVPSSVSGRAENVSCRLSMSARLISSFSGVAWIV
jgi:hypothetical protein